MPPIDATRAAATAPPPTDSSATRGRSAAVRGGPAVPLPQAVAACTAFAAFSISIVVGLASDNATDTVLLRAIGSLAFGGAGGFAVGLVCDWIARSGRAREALAENAVLAEESRETRASDVPEEAASTSQGDLG